MKFLFVIVGGVVVVLYYIGTLSNIKSMESSIRSVTQTIVTLTGDDITIVDSTIEEIPEGQPKEYYDGIQ